jgi:hypothetical protein
MTKFQEAMEIHRSKWAEIAIANGWHSDPFFIQIWMDPKTNQIWDSVSFIGLDRDIIIKEEQPNE